jgi:hypothetical protein
VQSISVEEMAAALCTVTHRTGSLLSFGCCAHRRAIKNRRYVRQRTDRPDIPAYNINYRWQHPIRLTRHWRKIMAKNSKQYWLTALCGAAVVLMAGCSSMKTPATASVAVSKAAVESASGAGGAEFAPVEMNSAREKMALANKAMAAKDYKLANELATQAQADAKLAQGKANSAKAQTAANALQDDIRVLREELERTNK